MTARHRGIVAIEREMRDRAARLARKRRLREMFARECRIAQGNLDRLTTELAAVPIGDKTFGQDAARATRERIESQAQEQQQ